MLLRTRCVKLVLLYRMCVFRLCVCCVSVCLMVFCIRMACEPEHFRLRPAFSLFAYQLGENIPSHVTMSLIYMYMYTHTHTTQIVARTSKTPPHNYNRRHAICSQNHTRDGSEKKTVSPVSAHIRISNAGQR